MRIIVALLSLLLGAAGLGLVETVYLNFPALVTATIGLTQFINGKFELKHFAAQVVSWGMGVLLTVIGYYADDGLGFLAGLELWQMILTAIGVSLASNGFYDAVKYFLEYLGIIEKDVEKV
ncbi:MAG: hypothetical protein ACLFVR_14640 [Thiohalospira sp.]